MPCPPHNMKVDVAECHACFQVPRLLPSATPATPATPTPTPTPARPPARTHARAHAHAHTQPRRPRRQRGPKRTTRENPEGRCRQVPRLPAPVVCEQVVCVCVCEAGVAFGSIDVHSVWQAWRLWHWAGSGGVLGSRWRRGRGCLCGNCVCV